MKRPAVLWSVATACVLWGSATAVAQHAPAPDALPGAYRVGLPDLGLGTPRLTVAGFGGYGWIPGLTDEGGDHHRLAGGAAVGILPIEWLGVAAGLEGFWDVHPDDALGGDDSGLGSFFLAVRGGVRLPEGFAIGADVRWDLVGADAPDVQLEASRLSLRALASVRPAAGPVTVGVVAGYRLDGTARTVDNVAVYRRGDRVSLGAASNDALLFGLAGMLALPPLDVLLEATFEPYVRAGAPPLDTAPLRFAGGARVEVAPDLRVQAMLEVTAHRRPTIDVDTPLVPSEPRVALVFGVTYAPSLVPAAPALESDPELDPEDTEPDADPVARARPITGIVADDQGSPLAGAAVELAPGGGGEPLAQRTTDAQGRYAIDPLPPGSYRLQIRAEGYEPREVPVEIAAGSGPVELDTVGLNLAVPAGALRGLVRDFRGEPVRAQIRVAPGDHQAETDADGLFEIEVPPGQYDVEVRAQGFVTQQRQVRVNENGVTILNVDLRRGR